MLTNLCASVIVTLVTNVTEKFPTHSAPVPCPDGMIGCAVYHSKPVPVENPTTKTVITECKEILTVGIVWGDDVRSSSSEKVLWTKSQEMRLEVQKTWQPVPSNELSAVDLPPGLIAVLSNRLSGFIISNNVSTNASPADFPYPSARTPLPLSRILR